MNNIDYKEIAAIVMISVIIGIVAATAAQVIFWLF